MGKKIVIKGSNAADYRHLHWWALLLFVTLGSSILLALFKMSWLLLIAAVAVVWTLQKQLRIQIIVEEQRIRIQKTFLGLVYSSLSQSFDKVFFQKDNISLRFEKNPSDCLFLRPEHGQIQAIKGKQKIALGNHAEGQQYFEQLLKACRVLELRYYEWSHTM